MLSHRQEGSSKFYLIKWRSPDREPTWEPDYECRDIRKLVAKYYEREEGTKKRRDRWFDQGVEKKRY